MMPILSSLPAMQVVIMTNVNIISIFLFHSIEKCRQWQYPKAILVSGKKLASCQISMIIHAKMAQTVTTHYHDVIMGVVASQITSLMIVYSTVDSDADQRKHQSSASLAFVRGIHRGPVNSPHKWPVTRKMFPFDDVIMFCWPDDTRGQGVTSMILTQFAKNIPNTVW